MNEAFFKTMDGTGANIDIACGFVPAYVKVVNIESTTMEELEWFKGMADASAIKHVTGTVARTKITSLGITPLNDSSSSTGEKGFRIGADTDVNVAGETIVIMALRGGAGQSI